MQLSTHGVTEAGNGKEKYLLNILQKKNFTRSVRNVIKLVAIFLWLDSIAGV